AEANFEHPRVTYAINKNKRTVQQTISDMEKVIETNEQMKTFITEREELAKLHCAKDAKGGFKFKKQTGRSEKDVQMVYDVVGVDNEKSVYRKALAKLEAKYKEEIDKHTEKVRKYNDEFLDDESEYSPHMIELSFFEAEEKCPQKIMDMIYFMIKE
ncbi:hypothetical protein KKC59_04960, partial [bacterium]|nr:hypothetical protein [bacterium]